MMVMQILSQRVTNLEKLIEQLAKWTKFNPNQFDQQQNNSDDEDDMDNARGVVRRGSRGQKATARKSTSAGGGGLRSRKYRTSSTSQDESPWNKLNLPNLPDDVEFGGGADDNVRIKMEPDDYYQENQMLVTEDNILGGDNSYFENSNDDYEDYNGNADHNEEDNSVSGRKMFSVSNHEPRNPTLMSEELSNLPYNLRLLLNPDSGLFRLHSVSGTKVMAKCLLCRKNKIISASLKASSNLLTHLKVVHPQENEEWLERKVSEKLGPRKRKAADVDQKQQKQKQGTLDFYKIGETSGKQEQITRLVAKFIVSTLSPLSIVEDSAFLQLMSWLNSDVIIPKRDVVRNRILSFHLDAQGLIRKKLSAAEYVCATVDCWSTNNRRYLGVTAHWLNPQFMRESGVLTFCRLMKEHNFETITSLLSSVFQKYELDNNKIVCLVTDNVNNFVRVFNKLGIHSSAISNQDDDVDREDTGEDLELKSVAEILNAHENQEKLRLPKYFRSVAHTLTQIAIHESTQVNDRDLLLATFRKCSALWTQSSFPKSAETILDIAKKPIIRPCATKWNSKFDAICRLVEIKDSLYQISNQLKLPVLEQQEIEFLTAYVTVFSPINSALDTLQKEQEVYLADLFPEILRIEKKLLEDSVQKNTLAKPMADMIIMDLKARFNYLFEFDEKANAFICATMCHPFYKTRWIPSDKVDICKSIFSKVAYQMMEQDEPHLSQQTENEYLDEALFKKAKRFEFNSQVVNSRNTESIRNRVDLECLKFYQEKNTDLDVLDLYPMIKRIFRKYNTQLSSSSPVERLFSQVGKIMRHPNQAIGDDLFEAIAMLKCNNSV